MTQPLLLLVLFARNPMIGPPVQSALLHLARTPPAHVPLRTYKHTHTLALTLAHTCAHADAAGVRAG
jgi:hypothetical protein